MAFFTPYCQSSEFDSTLSETTELVAFNHNINSTNSRSFRHQVQECYLEKWIPCGIQNCQECYAEADHGSGTLIASPDVDLLILDETVVLSQIDLLKNEKGINNVLLFYSVLKKVRQKKMFTYTEIRKLFEESQKEVAENFHNDRTVRRYSIFPNDFFEATSLPKTFGETDKIRDREVILKAAKWFSTHLEYMTERVILLTCDSSLVEEAYERNVNCMHISDYIDILSVSHPQIAEQFSAPAIDNPIENGCAPIFPEYLDQKQIMNGLRCKTLYQGIIRMQPKNCNKGKVHCESLGLPIYINGKIDLNRAIDGDAVVIELVTNKDDCDLPEIMKNEEEDIENSESTVARLDPELELDEAGDIFESNKCGRVVAVTKRNWRQVCGSLRPINDATKAGGSLAVQCSRIFIPIDGRIPFVQIKTKASNELDGKRIMVVIDSWSRFSKYPMGHWTEIVGNRGDKETESEIILREHGYTSRDFSSGVLACLVPTDWKITEDEIQKREDFRNKVVFSVDPPGCKDIDDALSCQLLKNGNYEIGVHIADVTHFVHPETALDKEASERCTTVYLVEKRTDMLPSRLTTDLCSLVEKQDRLAFSAIFEMNMNGDVLATRFAKTIIRSHAAMTYAQAQAKIDDLNDNTEIAASLRALNTVAKSLRYKRTERGALQLASLEVKFKIDSDTAEIKDVALSKTLDTNKMIEEYMLLANISVAKRILEDYPMTSVLRRHPQAKMDALESLSNILNKAGFTNFKYGNSHELSSSLDRCIKNDDPSFNQIVRLLCCRCMNQAVYTCSGNVDVANYSHFALASHIYTHFTSPIRRYADIMVHRLLAACLGVAPLPSSMQDKQHVIEQCQKLNVKNLNARQCHSASAEYFSYLYFSERGPSLTSAIILNVTDKGIQCASLDYGIEAFVSLQQEDFLFNEAKKTLQSIKNPSVILAVFSKVTLSLSADESSVRNRIRATLIQDDL